MNDDFVDIFNDTQDIKVENKKKVINKKTIIIAITALVVLLLIIGGSFAGGVYWGRKNTVVSDMPLLEEAYELLRDYYYEDISWEEFQVLATNGMMGSVDKFTWLTSVDNSMGSVALGLSISSNQYNVHTISNITPQSPCDYATAKYRYSINDIANGEQLKSEGVDVSNEEVHIELGDELYAIAILNLNPIILEHMSRADVTTHLGLTNKVKLFIRKNGTDNCYLFDIEKEFIVSQKAFYYSSEEIGDDIGDTAMIKFTSFQDTAVADFSLCVDKFIQDGKKNLILDLRGNGGGNSDILGFIGGCLLKGADKKELNICYYKYNAGKGKYKSAYFTTNMGMNCETYDGNNDYYEIKNLPSLVDGFKLTVLVDGGSASCSEALLGALLYYNDVEFIGEKTYGKGVGQTVRTLSDGVHYVYITNGKYFIPTSGENGKVEWTKSIHGVGFTPVGENKIDIEYLPYDKDTCIKRALTILNS